MKIKDVNKSNEFIEEIEKNDPLKGEPFRVAVRKIFSLTADTASHTEIRDRILSGGKVTGTNMCVLVLAILIASIGLNMNSTAVIIGAMLVSPLMGSILAMSYGAVSVDARAFGTHAVGFLVQIGISLTASTVYFLISPIKTATAELLARTNPTFYDVLIAVAGGLAGIIGQTRKDKSNNIIPGVAIATALMPPLCTCGYSIATLNWKMLLGASYLFLVNSYFIFLSSAVILSALRIPKIGSYTQKQWVHFRNRMIRNTIIVVMPSIILMVLMVLQNN